MAELSVYTIVDMVCYHVCKGLLLALGTGWSVVIAVD